VERAGRPVATSPDSDLTLSIEEPMERFARSGVPVQYVVQEIVITGDQLDANNPVIGCADKNAIPASHRAWDHREKLLSCLSPSGSWRDELDPSKPCLHCLSDQNSFSLSNASGSCQ
jgi:hypothetical protein